MNMEQALLEAIHHEPAEEANWLVLADWLEDEADARAEVVRLTRALRSDEAPRERPAREERLRRLLASGVLPCVPLLTNALGMRLALVPAGTFWMGAGKKEKHGSEDEGPRHEVTIAQPFYLGTCQVTQEQFQRAMGHNPSYFRAGAPGEEKVDGIDARSFPVESVSWDDAVAFCAKLSGLPEEKAAGRVYRLPTEAEWEHACRGGLRSPTHFGDQLSSTRANFDGNYPFGGARKGPYPERPVPVGSYPPNAFGLYDMHGNVWEWCADFYDASAYAARQVGGSPGPPTGHDRVQRGGSWFSYGWACRAAERCRSIQTGHNERSGFRVALTVPGPR